MFYIRKYQLKDKEVLREICMETAKKGYQKNEAVCWMFLDYYLESEPDNVFILCNDDQAIGYIVASTNAKRYQERMKSKWIPMIQKKSILLGIFSKICLRTAQPLDVKYGGGFHMNIRLKYQRLGLGKRLLDVMKYHLLSKGNSYLYLITQNKRTRGYGFYRHYGFKVLKQYFSGSIALVYELNYKN